MLSTADDLRKAIEKAQHEFRRALSSAAANWDQRPGGHETEWTPRQVAEHAAENELWYASEICKGCGLAGVEVREFSFASFGQAIAVFDEAVATSTGRLKSVSNSDLEKNLARFENVADAMRSYASHLREHADQLLLV